MLEEYKKLITIINEQQDIIAMLKKVVELMEKEKRIEWLNASKN